MSALLLCQRLYSTYLICANFKFGVRWHTFNLILIWISALVAAPLPLGVIPAVALFLQRRNSKNTGICVFMFGRHQRGKTHLLRLLPPPPFQPPWSTYRHQDVVCIQYGGEPSLMDGGTVEEELLKRQGTPAKPLPRLGALAYGFQFGTEGVSLRCFFGPTAPPPAAAVAAAARSSHGPPLPGGRPPRHTSRKWRR